MTIISPGLVSEIKTRVYHEPRIVRDVKNIINVDNKQEWPIYAALGSTCANCAYAQGKQDVCIVLPAMIKVCFN